MIDISKQRFKYAHIVPQINLKDEAFCYWLGFVLADGCISSPEKTGSQRLVVGLKQDDKIHLEKLRSWLQSDHPIYFREKTHACVLSIRSQSLADMFALFGITPKKSLIVTVDDRLKNRGKYL